MIYALFILTVFFPLTVFAEAGYNPLVNLPGGIGDPVANFSQFLNTLYAIAIAVAALLAVIKIVIAGVKYMLSDVVTNKASAKADIQGALFGLIIVIGAVLILDTINPRIIGGDLGSGPAVTGVTRTSATSATAPIPIERGDRLFNYEGTGLVLGVNPSEAEKRNLCENKDPSACGDSWWSRSVLGKPQFACYNGTYIPESERCLVKAADLQLNSFACTETEGRDPVTGSREYSCRAAFDACRIAGGAGEAARNGREVNCNY